MMRRGFTLKNYGPWDFSLQTCFVIIYVNRILILGAVQILNILLFRVTFGDPEYEDQGR
jgi:hypothetical protein